MFPWGNVKVSIFETKSNKNARQILSTPTFPFHTFFPRRCLTMPSRFHNVVLTGACGGLGQALATALLDACVAAEVRHVVVSSSGAAYGYHADNPAWLTEDMPLRGNEVFAYAHHKRLVEEMLAQYRQQHPALLQTVLRIGTILGERVDNQITALFEKPRLIAIRGSDSPFVFIWDQDVTGAILHALGGAGRPGCYNLAGDGALSIHEIARALGKRTRNFPAAVLKAALGLGSALGVSRYGPEQLDFLRNRPVLLNTALKTRFGYTPGRTSRQAFEAFIAARAAQGRPVAIKK